MLMPIPNKSAPFAASVAPAGSSSTRKQEVSRICQRVLLVASLSMEKASAPGVDEHFSS
jgi:hypothetical protein